MKKSLFLSDLEKEKALALFLNTLYEKHLIQYTYIRETRLQQQLRGVDLILTRRRTQKRYYLDEKAQLDYINEDLPTFAFELSYQTEGIRRQGWLLDPKKKTQFYALITGIYSDEPNVFTAAKITLLNRGLLLGFLRDRGLNEKTLALPKDHGRKIVPQLDPSTEGYLFLSKSNKVEQPLNLVLRLDFLLGLGIAKRLV